MEKGFYHPTLGYWQTTNEPPDEILASYAAGTIEVPVMPGPGYTFDGANWVAPTQQWLDDRAAMLVRGERASRLYNHVDPVVTNALRWNSMPAEKQAQWAAYRTALLDITDQSGFPHNVVWPTKPE